jgi:hypothetical protein
VQLFDLSKDIGEENNLAKHLPEETAQLHQRLGQYIKSVDAQMPESNPNYNPPNSSGQTGPENGTETEPKTTDFNGDGKGDFEDFLEFARAYGSNQPRFDLDDSGRVDFADFLRFAQDFGSIEN